VPERRHEHESLDFPAADLNQTFTEVDLQLTPGGVSDRTVASASAYSACR